MARISKLGLRVQLPAAAGVPIRYETASGRRWGQVPVAAPGAEVRSDALWGTIERELARTPDGAEADLAIERAGQALGAWLFDSAARMVIVSELVEPAAEDGIPRRIELDVPDGLADWPWEIAAFEGVGPIGIHADLTVVRTAGALYASPGRPTPPLVVDLVGVDLDDRSAVPLKTGDEVRTIRARIEGAGASLEVREDARGTWEGLLERFAAGRPHVVHFGGHGVGRGWGLVFRGAGGGPVEIGAEQVAQHLCGRPVHLVFLNACSTAAGATTADRPFGGLARRLVARGVPAFVGMHMPIRDRDAAHLAESFYRAVARGDGLDCALQQARLDLFSAPRSGPGFAFATLTARAEAHGPLVGRKRGAAHEVEDLLDELGHRPQGSAIKAAFAYRTPSRSRVFVVHGPPRTGQRYVVERAQRELGRRGIDYQPVAPMRWFPIGEPLLRRQQLLGGIARALKVDDRGPGEGLEARLAQAVARRCRTGKWVVFDLVEVLVPLGAQAEALVALIRDVWDGLMRATHNALRAPRALPVVLLVPVAHSGRGGTSEADTGRAIEGLKALAATDHVQVTVLEKLEPIGEREVFDFLRDVLQEDAESARAWAQDVAQQAADTEDVIVRVRRHIEDLQGDEP